MNSLRHNSVLIGLLVLTGMAFAQSGKAPSVTMAPVPLVTTQRATPTTVKLDFRVAPGFHINSNAPKSEFLIPTALKMDPPTDIVLGKTEYPEGKDLSFPFSPEKKLNVYSGDLTIKVVLHSLSSLVPGKYAMRGSLPYQSSNTAPILPP